ncbi:MAG: DUF2299 family protein [Chthoniobacterales bacterium]
MLKNKFLAIVLTIGSFLAWIITMLAFFGIDAKSIKDQMTSHYIFLVSAVTFFCMFVWGISLVRKSLRFTPQNAERKIRGWLDNFGYSHRLSPWEPWYFGLEVTLNRGPLLFIARPRARADQLLFLGKITAIAPQQRAAFTALSELEKEKFYSQVRLETARAKIIFNSDPLLDQVSIEKWVPITPKFTASALIEAVNEVYFSANIIWSTITLRLGLPPLPMLPSSAPDTGVSPPSQVS